MAGLARAAIEKIVIEKISGRARIASSDFFIGLTSREISCDVMRASEILHTFQTLERAEKLLFLGPGNGGGQPILWRIQGFCDRGQLPSYARRRRARTPVSPFAQAAFGLRRRSLKPSINR